MGGLFGFVGLGKVIGSQKTTPLELRSRRSALARIELCEIPVLGALDIKDWAEDVAVCRTGFPISGLKLAGVEPEGSVDDLGMFICAP